MTDTYTKLFSSITESTVWGEPYSTRIVWVAMLAMADSRGDVYGSVPGLARRANVSLPEVQQALSSFLAPDPHSRTKDEDGRRIEEIDGGWRLLNHGKYSAVRNAAERAEYKRQWDREHRGNRPKARDRKKNTPDKPPTKSDTVRQNPTNPTPPALTPALTPTPTPGSRAKPSALRKDQPVRTRDARHADAPMNGPPDSAFALVGTFEGQPEAPRETPNPAAALAIALRQAGFPVTSMHPGLLAYAAEGGTAAHLAELVAHPDCAGKAAGYVIAFARRELADPAKAAGTGPPGKSKTRNAIETVLRGLTDDRHDLAEQRDPEGDRPAAVRPSGRRSGG